MSHDGNQTSSGTRIPVISSPSHETLIIFITVKCSYASDHHIAIQILKDHCLFYKAMHIIMVIFQPIHEGERILLFQEKEVKCLLHVYIYH